MDKEKKEKAISQALASLRIDDIDVSSDFLALYLNRYKLTPENAPKLFIKRSIKNDKHE